MSSHPPPVLPPFDADPQTIEAAVQEQLDLHAQVRFLKQQNTQLAARQGALALQVSGLRTDVERGANAAQVAVGSLQIIHQGMKAIAKKLGAHIPDLPESVK